MGMRKLCVAFLAVMAVSFALAVPARAGERTVTLKMGNVVNEGHSYIVASRWMAEELKKRTNGRLNLEVYTANQLGRNGFGLRALSGYLSVKRELALSAA